MKLRIRLFASIRERAKTSEINRDFRDGASVEEIWRELVSDIPALAGHDAALSYAVNQEYVERDYRPADGDEVAFIPPVSGGAAPPPWIKMVNLGREPLDIAALENAVADDGAGALVTFVGTVRDNNAGRRVLRLEYEAYEPMALREMHKLAEQAGSRFHITRIAISHRIGMLEIGEASVAIAVSAAHRGAAFEACRYTIDKLKEVVPIWKKEHFEGGQIWVGCQTSHPPALQKQS